MRAIVCDVDEGARVRLPRRPEPQRVTSWWCCRCGATRARVVGQAQPAVQCDEHPEPVEEVAYDHKGDLLAWDRAEGPARGCEKWTRWSPPRAPYPWAKVAVCAAGRAPAIAVVKTGSQRKVVGEACRRCGCLRCDCALRTRALMSGLEGGTEAQRREARVYLLTATPTTVVQTPEERDAFLRDAGEWLRRVLPLGGVMVAEAIPSLTGMGSSWDAPSGASDVWEEAVLSKIAAVDGKLQAPHLHVHAVGLALGWVDYARAWEQRPPGVGNVDLKLAASAGVVARYAAKVAKAVASYASKVVHDEGLDDAATTAAGIYQGMILHGARSVRAWGVAYGVRSRLRRETHVDVLDAKARGDLDAAQLRQQCEADEVLDRLDGLYVEPAVRVQVVEEPGAVTRARVWAAAVAAERRRVQGAGDGVDERWLYAVDGDGPGLESEHGAKCSDVYDEGGTPEQPPAPVAPWLRPVERNAQTAAVGDGQTSTNDANAADLEEDAADDEPYLVVLRVKRAEHAAVDVVVYGDPMDPPPREASLLAWWLVERGLAEVAGDIAQSCTGARARVVAMVDDLLAARIAAEHAGEARREAARRLRVDEGTDRKGADDGPNGHRAGAASGASSGVHGAVSPRAECGAR